MLAKQTPPTSSPAHRLVIFGLLGTPLIFGVVVTDPKRSDSIGYYSPPFERSFVVDEAAVSVHRHAS